MRLIAHFGALVVPALVAALAPASALAQSAPPAKLVIYGNQKCPTDANGAEIVVCERRSSEEQFRIPKELRELEITPENQSWAVRAQANDGAGASGIGSCSAVGPAGSTGCFMEEARATRAFNKARKQADKQVQDALP